MNTGKNTPHKAPDEQPPGATSTRALSENVRKRLWMLLRLAVATTLLLAVLWWVDFELVLSTILASKMRYIPVLLALLLLDRYIMAYKWALLLRARGVAISNLAAFRIYLLSGFLGIFLPTSVGADAVKIARTSLAMGNLGRVTASTIMERALGLLALVVVAATGLGLMLVSEEEQFLMLFYASCMLIVLIVFAVLLSLNSRLFRWLNDHFSQLAKYRIGRILLDSHEEYVRFGTDRKILFWFFCLSILEHIVLGIVAYGAGLALGLDLNVVYYLAIIPVASAAGMMPISIGGLGVKEGVLVLLFTMVGLSGEEAFAFALYSRILALASLIPGGVIFWRDATHLKWIKNNNRNGNNQL